MMEILEKKVIRNFLNRFPKEKEEKILKAVILLGIDYSIRCIPENKLNSKELKMQAKMLTKIRKKETSNRIPSQIKQRISSLRAELIDLNGKFNGKIQELLEARAGKGEEKQAQMAKPKETQEKADFYNKMENIDTASSGKFHKLTPKVTETEILLNPSTKSERKPPLTRHHLDDKEIKQNFQEENSFSIMKNISRSTQSEKKIQTLPKTFEQKSSIQGKNLGPIFQLSNEKDSLMQLLTENESPKFMGAYQISHLSSNNAPEQPTKEKDRRDNEQQAKLNSKEPLREIRNSSDYISKDIPKRESVPRASNSTKKDEKMENSKGRKGREAKNRKKFFSINGIPSSRNDLSKKATPSYLKNVQSKIKDEVRMTREMLQYQYQFQQQQTQQQYQQQPQSFFQKEDQDSTNFQSYNQENCYQVNPSLIQAPHSQEGKKPEIQRKSNIDYFCYQEEVNSEEENESLNNSTSRADSKNQVSYALSYIPRRDSYSTSPISRQSNLFRKGEEFSMINHMPNFEKYDIEYDQKVAVENPEVAQNNYINVNNYIQNPNNMKTGVLSPQSNGIGHQRFLSQVLSPSNQSISSVHLRSVQSPVSVHFQSVQNPFESNFTSVPAQNQVPQSTKNSNILDIANSFLNSPLMKQLSINNNNYNSNVTNSKSPFGNGLSTVNYQEPVESNSKMTRSLSNMSSEKYNYDHHLVKNSSNQKLNQRKAEIPEPICDLESNSILKRKDEFEGKALRNISKKLDTYPEFNSNGAESADRRLLHPNDYAYLTKSEKDKKGNPLSSINEKYNEKYNLPRANNVFEHQRINVTNILNDS